MGEATASRLQTPVSDFMLGLRMGAQDATAKVLKPLLSAFESIFGEGFQSLHEVNLNSPALSDLVAWKMESTVFAAALKASQDAGDELLSQQVSVAHMLYECMSQLAATWQLASNTFRDDVPYATKKINKYACHQLRALRSAFASLRAHRQLAATTPKLEAQLQHCEMLDGRFDMDKLGPFLEGKSQEVQNAFKESYTMDLKMLLGETDKHTHVQWEPKFESLLDENELCQALLDNEQGYAVLGNLSAAIKHLVRGMRWVGADGHGPFLDVELASRAMTTAEFAATTVAVTYLITWVRVELIKIKSAPMMTAAVQKLRKKLVNDHNFTLSEQMTKLLDDLEKGTKTADDLQPMPAPKTTGGVPSAAKPGDDDIDGVPATPTELEQNLFEKVPAGAEATAGDSAAAAAAPAPKRRRISGIVDRLASAMTA